MGNRYFTKVRFWNEDGIGIITIDNGNENFLDMDVITQLTTALMIANNDNNINWVVITGTGTSFFTAGIPWEAVEPRYATVRDLIGGVKALYSIIITMDKPVITVLNGSALGMGMELALISDLTIVPPDIYMCYPEGLLGIPMPLGSRIILERLPRYMAINVLAGMPLSANDASGSGIVHLVGRENLFGDAKSIIKGLKISQYVRRELTKWARDEIDSVDSTLLNAISSVVLDQKGREELIRAVRSSRIKCVSKYKGV
ncbi:MAG: enoyl-CoA hydratase/isomerase family protein [Vulcanisaeta sp.]